MTMNAKHMLSLAYSPCPNDTFMFCAIADGRVVSPRVGFDIRLADVETLNGRVLAGEVDVSKVSFHAWLRARDRYTLLDAGAALGFGCGPLLVARRADALDDRVRVRIAVPGALTTANLLLHLWRPDAGELVFLPYDRILSAVCSGEVDAGVIIHESRFVYRQAGLVALVDLGAWWESETGLPVPLGGIVARRSLDADVRREVDALIRASIQAARRDPESTRGYVAAHARELDPSVLASHVATFVNDFSLSLGEQGRAAVDRLAAMAVGMVPEL